MKEFHSLSDRWDAEERIHRSNATIDEEIECQTETIFARKLQESLSREDWIATCDELNWIIATVDIIHVRRTNLSELTLLNCSLLWPYRWNTNEKLILLTLESLLSIVIWLTDDKIIRRRCSRMYTMLSSRSWSGEWRTLPSLTLIPCRWQKSTELTLTIVDEKHESRCTNL